MAEEGEQEFPSNLFVHAFPQNHVSQGLGKLRSAKPATYGAAMASLHHPVSHSIAGEETVSPLVLGATEIKVVLGASLLLQASQGHLLQENMYVPARGPRRCLALWLISSSPHPRAQVTDACPRPSDPHGCRNTGRINS